MKAVKDYIRKLPTRHRNLARQFMFAPELMVDSMSDALRYGCKFTEKDKYFWLDVSDHYLLGDPMPAVPRRKVKISFVHGDGSVNSPFWQDGEWENLKEY